MEKKKIKKTKEKEIKLPMKFNPGRQIYEPELPALSKGKKPRFKDVWVLIILILLIVALGIAGLWISKRITI